MITYKLLKTDMVDQTISFWKQIKGVHLHENGEDTKEGIDAYLLRNPDCSYIAVEGEMIVGAILAGHDGRRGFINHLAVAPEYRKQGIATKLIQLAENAFKKNGIHKSALFVLKDNYSGIEFYKKIGWTEETIVDIYSNVF